MKFAILVLLISTQAHAWLNQPDQKPLTEEQMKAKKISTFCFVANDLDNLKITKKEYDNPSSGVDRDTREDLNDQIRGQQAMVDGFKFDYKKTYKKTLSLKDCK